MNILQILTVWLVSVVILSFVKLKWGICLYIVYSIIVPKNIELGIPGLGGNHIIFFMSLSYFIHYYRKNHIISIYPFIPIVAYFVVSLLVMPFQDGTPLDYMVIHWRRGVFGILFLPIIIWNVMRNDYRSILLFRNTFLICFIITIGYGLFQTTLGGFNPYTLALAQYMDLDMDYEQYYTETNGRLFGRISSVFLHPMNFALFIGFVLIYIIYIRKELGKCRFIFFVVATSVMAVVCGVRSVLGGLFFVGIYYCLMKRNLKLVLSAIGVGLIGLIVLSFLPSLSDYLGSIRNPENVGGSSIEMRLNQLDGAIDEALKNPIFGLGYQWTDYYQSIRGDHPICLAFESLAFVVICNSGIVGVLLWLFMVVKSFEINKKLRIKDCYLINSLLVFYIAFSMITGEYGYMKYYLLFYVMSIGENLLKNSIFENECKLLREDKSE